MNPLKMMITTGFLIVNIASAMATEPAKTLSVNAFMRRFKISYTVLSMSDDGTRLLNSKNYGWVSEDSIGPIEKDLHVLIFNGDKDQTDSRALKMTITLHDDGEVTAHLEEFHRKDIVIQDDGKTVGKTPLNVVDQKLTDFSAFN